MVEANVVGAITEVATEAEHPTTFHAEEGLIVEEIVVTVQTFEGDIVDVVVHRPFSTAESST